MGCVVGASRVHVDFHAQTSGKPTHDADSWLSRKVNSAKSTGILSLKGGVMGVAGGGRRASAAALTLSGLAKEAMPERGDREGETRRRSHNHHRRHRRRNSYSESSRRRKSLQAEDDDNGDDGEGGQKGSSHRKSKAKRKKKKHKKRHRSHRNKDYSADASTGDGSVHEEEEEDDANDEEESASAEEQEEDDDDDDDDDEDEPDADDEGPQNGSPEASPATRTATLQGPVSMGLQRMRELPAVVFTLHSLRTLDVSDNDIGPSFAAASKLTLLSNLKTLTMRNNRLAGSFPMAIAHCAALQTLSLEGNRIRHLPAVPRSLRRLFLGGNELVAFPACLASVGGVGGGGDDDGGGRDGDQYPASLEEVDLRNNAISGALPRTLGRLRRLRILKLDGNLISAVNESVHDMRSLKTLTLSRNALPGTSESLPEAMFSAPSLTHLDLSGNGPTGLTRSTFLALPGAPTWTQRRDGPNRSLNAWSVDDG